MNFASGNLQRPPPDLFCGISKQELAKMSPADIVFRMRKVQAAEKHEDGAHS